jgi:biotin transporter BioY
MQISYMPVVAIAVFAIVFYRAGKMEHSWGVLWAALSALIGILAMMVLGWGWLGFFGGQIALFIAITFYRIRQP